MPITKRADVSKEQSSGNKSLSQRKDESITKPAEDVNQQHRSRDDPEQSAQKRNNGSQPDFWSMASSPKVLFGIIIFHTVASGILFGVIFIYAGRIEKLESRLQKFENAGDDLSPEIASTVADINDKIDWDVLKIKEKIDEVVRDISNKIDTDVQKAKVDLEGKLEDKLKSKPALDIKDNTDLNAKLQALKDTLIVAIDNKASVILEQVVNLNKTTTNAINALELVNSALAENVSATLNQTEILKNNTIKMENDTKTKSKEMKEKVTGMNATQNRIMEFMKKFGDKVWDEVDTTAARLNNLEVASSNQVWYSILGHLFVLMISILMCLYLGNQTPERHMAGVSSSRVVDNTQKSRPIRSVLDEIQRRPLEKRVGIISFYAETQKLHKRLTDSACGGMNITLDQILIGRHENIPNLSPCQIFFVFVDFNERDIILENPKREVGDLKLTTVKGARKMGGDVFVIYVRDKGSKALEGGHLFNPRLMSIHNHDELIDLNSRKRVLSTYEGFTQYQIEHLSNCLKVLW